MAGLVFKPVDPEDGPAHAGERKPPMPSNEAETGSSGRRRRRKHGSSGWKRFKKGVGEQRRRIAVVVALVVSCGLALLIYMLIRPE